MARQLRCDLTQFSEVKAGDLVIWEGKAPTDGTTGSTGFIVDLGNTAWTGLNANASLMVTTPYFLLGYNVNSTTNVITYDVPSATGRGLWQRIMFEQGRDTSTTWDVKVNFLLDGTTTVLKAAETVKVEKLGDETFTWSDTKWAIKGYDIKSVTSVPAAGTHTVGGDTMTITNNNDGGTPAVPTTFEIDTINQKVEITVTYTPVESDVSLPIAQGPGINSVCYDCCNFSRDSEHHAWYHQSGRR